MSLNDAISQGVIDFSLLHQLIHGSSTQVVTTDGGPVPSVANVIANLMTKVMSSLTATSTTTNSITNDDKTFAIGEGKSFVPGQFVTASAGSNNFISGTIVGYANGSLVIRPLVVRGSGNFSAWNIAFSGPMGPAGLNGRDGTNGKDGFDGNDGSDGTNGADGTNGKDGINGKDGVDGKDGESAYQIAVRKGFTGTEEQWLLSLKGPRGNDGAGGTGGTGTGANGKSAYEIAVDYGFDGTELDWLISLDGKNAYQLAVDSGFTGTVTEWLASLKGEPGKDGTNGTNGTGGTGGGSVGSDHYMNVPSEISILDSTTVTADTFDANLGDTFTIKLTSNLVLPAVKNAQPGKLYRFIFIQDKVGDRKVTFDKKYKFAGNSLPTFSSAGEAIDNLSATYSSNGFFFCEYRMGYTVTSIARILNVRYDSMAAAVSAAQNGDTIYVTRSGQLAECTASIRADIDLTIAGDPTLAKIPMLHVDGTIPMAGQKAIINPESGNVLIRDIQLDGAATPDLSGGGVRGNPGQRHMRLERVKLTKNENGMLVGAPSTANRITSGYNLEIIDCEFDNNGQGNDGQSHNIYLNHYMRCYVLRSRFTNARYGHDFKTRADVVVLDRTYHKGALQARELDVPNGGKIYASNCYFIKDAGSVQANLIGIGQEGVTNAEEYVFRNCLFQNDQGGNFGETWIYHVAGGGTPTTVPVKFVDCVFLGSSRTINIGPFELYYTGGPIGPEGWDQANRGVIPKQGTYDTNAGNSFLPDAQQPKPINGPDPTLSIFPPTGSSAVPSVRPESAGPDITAPVVTLVSSATTVSAAGNIILTANATDNIGVVKVEFYRGGILINTDTTSPFTSTVAINDAANGTVTFTAVAYDAAGNSTMSAPVAVTVNILPPPKNFDFTMDTTTLNAYNSAIDAAAVGAKRLAGAQAIATAMNPDYRLYIYQESTLIVPMEFSGSLTVADDGTNVTVKTGTPDSADPLKFGDITAGTWHFELQGGASYTRVISGSVGPVGSGKMIEISDNPEPGVGANLVLSLVMPRSIDGLS